MHFSSAYLLVSHGSRDPRPQIALEHLAQLVTQRLRESTPIHLGAGHVLERTPLVGTAVLELAPLPLHQQIQQFAEQAMLCGYETIDIVPLFLLAGVHVMEDIPAEVRIAQQQLQNAQKNIQIHVRMHLGSQEQLWQLLINPVEPMTTDPQSGKVVVSHGSRRAEGNLVIEQIAAQIGALPAYWSVAPSLETQVTELIKRGYQQIAILPYFLFEGGITDAIGQTVEHLKGQFPYAQLHFSRPIGATSALADQAFELMTRSTPQKLR
ncbi:MAG: sirohydrochlorin chelatase [Cyanobacteria bacterium RM1_2_2]|nr:sirohydrochlorin chelatase [Cyanobacteria bacterium RM1_2_2]